MSLRPPKTVSSRDPLRLDALSVEAEILAERAEALGRSGRAVERALAAMRAAPPGETRVALAFAAAEAVQALFIQREMMGQRSHAEIIRLYELTPEVLGRLGAKPSAG